MLKGHGTKGNLVEGGKNGICCLFGSSILVVLYLIIWRTLQTPYCAHGSLEKRFSIQTQWGVKATTFCSRRGSLNTSIQMS